MTIAIVTGSAGLIGSEASRYFADLGLDIVGIDNDMRRQFFGAEASTERQRRRLEQELGKSYHHVNGDIRDMEEIDALFENLGPQIELVIHTAAQPSHDWAARDPHTDFGVNAVGTLNLLEATRRHAPEAVFIFTSTNKVYGDAPNRLPLIELETRWEIDPTHRYADGIAEDFSIDQSLHSLFGASKVAADVLVQEYGRYFGMPTCCLRGGCLTGPNHSGVERHGFLSYLIKCNVEEREYKVFGYKGKQVRDNIHSEDVAAFIAEFCRSPKCGEVYNIGGGRENSCSILEAFAIVEALTGMPQKYTYVDENRIGDHICYYSDLTKMKAHYPAWTVTRSLSEIFREIVESWAKRLTTGRRKLRALSVPMAAAG